VVLELGVDAHPDGVVRVGGEASAADVALGELRKEERLSAKTSSNGDVLDEILPGPTATVSNWVERAQRTRELTRE
jgi:hypothetical protein